mgnify:CR=1 FL=1
MADLFTFTLVGGTVLRYANCDMDIKVGATVFSSGGPRFARGRTRVSIGVEVDTLDVTVYADDTHLVNGVPFLQACASGACDGASLTLERAFMASWGDTSPGTVILFAGRCAEMQISRHEARLTVRSDLELLNVQMPRNLYQPGCLYTLFDGGCGLIKSTWGVNSSAGGGSTSRVINCGLGQAAGYFDLGSVTFTGGPNAGVSRTVKSYTPGVLTLSYPLPATPGVGDGFTAYPGCDKTQATCNSKFSNQARFRAFPFTPTPETAL